MRCSRANLRASAAVAAAILATTGCGGGDRGDGDAAGEVHTVAVVQASFPARQHVGQQSAFVITLRNAGDSTIPNLVVSLDGFRQRPGGEVQRPRWIVDEPPPGGVTAIDDTWAAGALAPGKRRTLRWRVTAVQPGTHELRYAVAAGLGDGARATLPDGGPARATLTVRVAAKPAFARVDPRSGRIIRE